MGPEPRRFAHPGSREVVAADDSAGLESLRGRSYCLLVYCARNGCAIPTALWFALRGERNLSQPNRTGAGAP